MLRTLTMIVLGVVLLTAGPAAGQWVAYGDIGPDLLAWETAYPTLAKRHSLGPSVGGRELWAIQISDNVGVEENEPEFKYIGAMHGDEIVGTTMCMNLVDYLLTNYGTDPQATRIIDEIDLWIVPVMNPDGYVAGTRVNNNGVDLNRDFPDYGEANSTVGRQQETALVMNWTALHSFVCSANFHGGALVANYALDNDLPPTGRHSDDEDVFIYISEEYTQHNVPMWNSSSFFHGISNGADWYVIYGSMQDWNYNFMGCNEVTMEIGVTKTPPSNQMPTYWNDNRDSMLTYLETCLIGVRGEVYDAYTGQPIAATVTVGGRLHDVFTDPDVGDYHRMLMPGTYDLTFSAFGYDSITITGVTVSAGDATVLDVPMGAPDPTVASPNGGEALTVDEEATVTWTGNPALPFQVQFTANDGDLSDGFETGSLDPAYTQSAGADQSWDVDGDDSYIGLYAAHASHALIDNQTAAMERTIDGSGTLTFWYRVSSESNFDFFEFYVDGVRELKLSGELGWTQHTEVLAAGTHTLKWLYSKDVSVSEGDDAAWIDDVHISYGSTTWADIEDLTLPGATSAMWTPTVPGDGYRVRVRAYWGGTMYSPWDTSDDLFSVQATASCMGDATGDGLVNTDDFLAVLSGWGQSGVPADVNNDGIVDTDDFLAVLSAWGPCL